MLNRLFASLPFLFPTICLGVGIVVQRHCHFSLFFVFSLLLAVVILLIVALRWRGAGVVSGAMGMLFVAVGMLFVAERDVRCSGRISKSASFKVVVEGDPVTRGDRMRSDARLIGMWSDSVYSKKNDKVWLYADSVHCEMLEVGSVWWVQGRLVPPRNRTDSVGGFDFESYAKARGLDYLLFASRYYVMRPSTYSGGSVSLFLPQLKRAVAARVRLVMPDEEVSAVAVSMLLGDKQRLPEDRKEAFRRSGLVHLLAVSGLHVGILFYLLYGLLFFIHRSSRWFWVKPLLVGIGVWAYVLVIGAPWSAARAGLMISVLLVGEMAWRGHSSMNALLATGFVLMCVEPYALFDVGFQLSFSATAAILCGAPLLSQLAWNKSWFVSRIISVAGVSVLAQMGTMLFTLYYFKSFPLLFLLSNVVVLPFMGLLLGATIVLLLLSSCGVDVAWVAEGLQWAYKGLIGWTEWVASIPWGVWEL